MGAPPTTSKAPTTTAPPTTTTAPPTTTQAPTTTAPPTKPSTQPPTNPPTPATPAVQKFNVTNSNGTALLLLDLGARISITSNSSSSSYSSSSDSIYAFVADAAVVDKKTTTIVDVPANAVVSDGSTSGVKLTFDSMTLTLTFASADDKWDLSNVTLKY